MEWFRLKFRFYSQWGKKQFLRYAMLTGVILMATCHAFADDVPIDSIHFPDPVFRAYVRDSIAGGKNTLTQSIINKRTSLGAAFSKKGGITSITSLKGVEYFTELQNLYCQDNPGLKSLDISKNTKLTAINLTGSDVDSLDFSHNPLMKTINCVGSVSLKTNTLKYINVDSCKNLTGLYLADNLLTSLDVTHNPLLTTLSCNNNQLSTLDLSKNTALRSLYVGKNSKLTTLDLSNNTALTYLSIDGNNMTTLDVSKLTKLQKLYCLNNKLTSLDLSNNTALTDLSCYSNRLESLVISPEAAPNITILNVSNNALASIDLSNFKKLVAKSGAFSSSAITQTRRMLLYTDGTDAYMKVADGIDASKISDAKIYMSNATTPITLSTGTATDGLVPLKFSNGSVRTRLFNWTTTTAKASPVTITYNYNTGSSLTSMATMNVTDTVECYLLPMSQEYGTVNLPYNVLLPTGATAYAVSAASSDAGTATLTKIAGEGEIVAANTPMLIRRSESCYTLFALNQTTGTANTAAANFLTGTKNDAISSTDNDYVLGLNSTTTSPNYGKLGFWRSSNGRIGNWRAYLHLTDATTSTAKGFVLMLDTATTGISTIEVQDDATNTPWYTIDGRLLGGEPSQRGIYIHNGKKIVVNK